MTHWPADRARARRGSSKVAYRELGRVPDLSLGVYRLPAGATDPQEPHSEDEVYVVLAGRARFREGRKEYPVGPGSILYVPAGARHSFREIEEELRVAVIFAPAEYTHKRARRS